MLMSKFEAAIRAKLPAANADKLMALVADPLSLKLRPLPTFWASSKLNVD